MSFLENLYVMTTLLKGSYLQLTVFLYNDHLSIMIMFYGPKSGCYTQVQLYQLQYQRLPFLDSLNPQKVSRNLKKKLLINNIILILKLYIYKSTEKQRININNLLAEIKNVKKMENEIAKLKLKKKKAFKNK